MPQMRRRPELEITRPELRRDTTPLVAALHVPVNRMVTLAKVELGMIAPLVAVFELVARAVEGAGDVAVGAALLVSVDFEDDGVAHPVSRGVGDPAQDGVFPVVLVGDVFFEVHAVVRFLCHPMSARGPGQKSSSRDVIAYPRPITALPRSIVRRHNIPRLARSSVVEGVEVLPG
jgi:hypothetical protein